MQGVRISLDKQLVNHGITFSRITESLGSKDSATQHLNKCLYYVGMGSNDYINNYYMPQNYCTSQNYTSEQYAEALITQYGNQIKVSSVGAACFLFYSPTHTRTKFEFFFFIDFAQLWSKEGCNIWSRTNRLHSICNYITWHKWFFVRGYD